MAEQDFKNKKNANLKYSWISPNYRGCGRFYSSCRDHLFSPLLTEKAVHAYAASFESYKLTLNSNQAHTHIHREREGGKRIDIEIHKLIAIGIGVFPSVLAKYGWPDQTIRKQNRPGPRPSKYLLKICKKV